MVFDLANSEEVAKLTEDKLHLFYAQMRITKDVGLKEVPRQFLIGLCSYSDEGISSRLVQLTDN